MTAGAAPMKAGRKTHKSSATFAGKMVEGLQGEGGSETIYLSNEHVISTAKHFIGDGGTLNGVDRGPTQGDETACA